MQIYTHEVLSERLIRIKDCLGVCCYLALGDERAALLDTCNGLGNIRSYAETLTDKPVICILTHGHLDHMGGAALFEERYMSPLDEPVFKKHGDMAFRVSEMNRMAGRENAYTEESFVPGCTGGIRPLSDGQRFDLGGLTVEMLAVPGHTPGMMCPLLTEERTVIFGDACGVGVLLFDEYSSPVSEYRKSLLRLSRHEERYDRILRNHGTFESPKELLGNVIECCDLILAGKDDHVNVSVHGTPLFAAKRPGAGGMGRADGKEGNLFYAADKVF